MEPLNEILKHVFVHYYEVVKKKQLNVWLQLFKQLMKKKRLTL